MHEGHKPEVQACESARLRLRIRLGEVASADSICSCGQRAQQRVHFLESLAAFNLQCEMTRTRLARVKPMIRCNLPLLPKILSTASQKISYRMFLFNSPRKQLRHNTSNHFEVLATAFSLIMLNTSLHVAAKKASGLNTPSLQIAHSRSHVYT